MKKSNSSRPIGRMLSLVLLSLLLSVQWFTAFAQNKEKVTGKVVDSNGQPLIGVTVVQDGTTNGVTTDVDGNFTISVPATALLDISYVGYNNQTIKVSIGKPITITLIEDNKLLEEVVVVGYGVTKRKNFTGSVSTIKTENTPLALQPTTSALDVLRGTVTGITISQQQGAGQEPSLLVRGQKSVNGGTSPLIVLDGMIYMGSYRDIDPSTIESISVLKDATSLAAYGSQAANGVIMITTKKGKIGKPIINISSSIALSTATAKPDVLSPSDYVKKVNLLSGLDENADPTWMNTFEYENYENGKTIDWFDYVTRTGVLQNYSASISGASEKMNYFLSSSYSDQKGIVIGDDYNRIGITAKLQNDITNWLQIGGQVNYTVNDYSGPTTYNLYQAVRLSPYGKSTRDNGMPEKYPVNEGVYRLNPLWNVKSGTIDDHDIYATTGLKGNILIKCPWLEGLSYRMNGSYSVENIEKDYFTHEGYYVLEGEDEDRYATSTVADYLASANGYSARTKNTSWVWDNIVNFTRQFGDHFLDVTYVYTRDSYEYNYRKFTGSDFSSLGNTNLGYWGLALAGTQLISSINDTLKTDVGYLGRINYNFKDTYHLNLSLRRDGSSVFGANHKWGSFPAIGVAWTISNEPFLKKISLINYLKLKTSWGKNGNQSLSPYETMSKITLGQSGGYSYTFGNTSEVSWGQRITSMGNADLAWESTESINYGFDLGLLKDRIHIEFDGYFSKTTNQIFSRTIPVMINGLTSIYATMGQVNNMGIEINLSTVNLQTKDFKWSSTLSYYLNRNKLKELYGDGEDDITNSLFLNKSLGAIYGYKPIGIVQTDDAEYISANGAVAGDVKFANLDGSSDGAITSTDRTILGYTKENFRMSFGNTFKYKDFELYALFTGVFGGNGYGQAKNYYAFRTASDVVGDNNLNHGWWTEENMSNKYPRIGYTNSNYTPLQGYGFVRLQDVSLSYLVPQSILKRYAIQNLKFYAACKNLFTITGWEGGDPEIQQTLGSGYSYGYPLSKTVSFGVNMTF
ncbi:MAG: TonB-dependent receptor [Bacteroidetes bacterium]|nr:TonB-dependent receptor [Bacteroidota bacterium]